MQYAMEFYLYDLREANGLTRPSNFPAISVVVANIFNGVNGGLALGTTIFARKLICSAWENETRAVFPYFVSIVIEAVVTSGVLHSFAHRLLGATLDGNGYVEFFAHLGYTINTIVTAFFLVRWLAPSYLQSHDGHTPGWHPRPIEVVIAITLSVLAVVFTQYWLPFEPIPEVFDYNESHQINSSRIVLMQRNIQGVLDGVLLLPTILFLFILSRLWRSILSSTSQDNAQKLSFDGFRVFILATAVPLCLNWIHFRCHDNLTNGIQTWTGWDHKELIAAIRVLFHIPPWILSIVRIHYLRLLSEQRARWPKLDIIEVCC